MLVNGRGLLPSLPLCHASRWLRRSDRQRNGSRWLCVSGWPRRRGRGLRSWGAWRVARGAGARVLRHENFCHATAPHACPGNAVTPGRPPHRRRIPGERVRGARGPSSQQREWVVGLPAQVHGVTSFEGSLASPSAVALPRGGGSKAGRVADCTTRPLEGRVTKVGCR